MKNILLAGKPNDVLKDLHVYLSRYFHVQMSTEEYSVMSGILKVVTPDLVVISLVGFNDISPKIFEMLKNYHTNTPVITIGTEAEQKGFLEYYSGKQFENMIRPIENKDVYKEICRKLGIESGSEPRQCVLAVDDNAATLRILKTMLEDKYDVMLAVSGAKAVAAITQRRPDVILMDYDMPICDGKQTLEMIRAEEDTRDIPVVFLTSVQDKKHITALLNLNVSGYMLKPPVKKTVEKEIRKAILRHERYKKKHA